MKLVSENTSDEAKRLVWFLSLAGFIPFGCTSLLLFSIGDMHPLYETLLDIFKIWSVIILSFLGGIRWGLALSGQPFDNRSLVLSVLGSIFAWFAILLPDNYSVLVLLLLFCAHGAWDSFYINLGKAPPWFGAVRITLTLLVVSAHVLVAVSLNT